ncbi:MAG: phage portal protein [Deferribacterales bacterium]
MGVLVDFPPTHKDISPFKGASIAESFGKMWLTYTATADEEVLSSLEMLRARSRYLCKNDVSGGMIENLVTNVVGTGLRLDITLDNELLGISEADAATWSRNVERRFQVWASSPEPDIENKRSFYTIQRNGFRSMLIDGDAIALLTNIERMGSISSLRVNTIDAARVQSSVSASGIIKDSNGMPVKMVVQNPTDNTIRTVNIYHELGLRNIVHSYIDVLIGQSRGLPFIQSIISRMRKLEKYSEAELGAAVITSLLVLAFEKAPSNGGAADAFKELLTGKSGDGKEQKGRDIHMTEGMQIDLEPGEKIQTVKSDRPNSGYGTFVESVWKEISIALNVPYEILTKQFGKSYSASRGAIHEAYKYFLAMRDQFASEFVQPIYERWLFEEVAEGRVVAPGYLTDAFLRRLWSAARWVGPPKSALDENKEASAAKTRIGTGYSTLKKEAAAFDGSNYEDVYAQRKREAEKERDLEAIKNESLSYK